MTSTQQSTVIAIFPDTSVAQAAARDLLSIGISRENMYIEAGRAGNADASRSGTSLVDEPGTDMPAHHGGVSGWFKSLFGGGDDADRSRYEDAVRGGNVLLSIHAREDQVDDIADILERHSPIDVHESAATAGESITSGAPVAEDRATERTKATRATENAAPAGAIPVVEEELQVGKRRVLRGGVRVYSRVVERPVEESINLSEDHVRVERRPTDRPVTDADLRSGQGNVVEVQEFAEEPVVAKNARVVEEVRIGKETTQRTENIQDSVRHTEVDVQQIPAERGTGAGDLAYDDTDFRNDFQSRYGSSGDTYETYAPAYRYGYEMASDPRYKGRSYDEIESQLKSDYSNRYPNSTWEKIKDSVRYGWNKVTGRAKAASR